MFNKLICFDFDGTLIHTPEPEIGKPIWERKTGLKWKKGWWSNKESLNPDYWDFPKVEFTWDYFVDACKQKDTFVFVATGRLQKLHGDVERILNINGIPYRNNYQGFGIDKLYCNPGINTFQFKTELFENIIRKNPGARNFTMFDDRQEHLPMFKEWAKNQPIEVSIFDVMNATKIL